MVVTGLEIVLIAWGALFGPPALALGCAAVYDWIDRRRQ